MICIKKNKTKKHLKPTFHVHERSPSKEPWRKLNWYLHMSLVRREWSAGWTLPTFGKFWSRALLAQQAMWNYRGRLGFPLIKRPITVWWWQLSSRRNLHLRPEKAFLWILERSFHTKASKPTRVEKAFFCVILSHLQMQHALTNARRTTHNAQSLGVKRGLVTPCYSYSRERLRMSLCDVRLSGLGQLWGQQGASQEHQAFSFSDLGFNLFIALWNVCILNCSQSKPGVARDLETCHLRANAFPKHWDWERSQNTHLEGTEI